MIEIESTKYYSIEEVNSYIKALFDNTITLQSIGLVGEINNYKGVNRSGHLYFTLKDEKSSLNAVMFKYDASRLEFTPHEGDKVLVIGSISTYIPNGTYQIIIKRMIPYGVGDSLLKKELLKKKLQAEGLFDESHKKQLPYFPKKIVIITGKNSAAEHDFQFNLNRRNPLVGVEFIYSLVQGNEAVNDLIESLKKAETSDADLIIIGRGGGSKDDLDCFDSEELVRTVYALKKPIISAIGHEINLSLVDLVSDYHVSTPSAACELSVPDINEIQDEINHLDDLINKLIKFKLQNLETKLLTLKNREYFINIKNVYLTLENKINNLKQIIDNYYLNKINNEENKISNLKLLINANNPHNILNKGYSITFNSNGKIIKSIKDAEINEELVIKLSDGSLKTIIKEKENGK